MSIDSRVRLESAIEESTNPWVGRHADVLRQLYLALDATLEGDNKPTCEKCYDIGRVVNARIGPLNIDAIAFHLDNSFLAPVEHALGLRSGFLVTCHRIGRWYTRSEIRAACMQKNVSPEYLALVAARRQLPGENQNYYSY